MKGYVYVLTNEAMPGLVKIGRSKTAAAGRARQMYSGDTGVPLPFDIYFECLFDDCIAGEQLVHEVLQGERINPNREFFRIDPIEAVNAVMNVRASDFDHYVVHSDHYVDTSVFYSMAEQLKCDLSDVSTIIELLTADELLPAMQRLQARRDRWSDANIARLKVVGEGDSTNA